MAATPPLRDRLSFLHRLPILLKGTSDDDVPCPGYLFEEIAKISHESLGSSQCLLEYLLNRLHSGSGRVKLKVLKILLHLCGHGSSSFLLILKRNPAFIQEAAVFAGPPDPLHGNSLYQKVRAAAQDLGAALYSDTLSPLPPSQPPRTLPPAGMGSQSRPQSTLQGFGYSKERGHTGSAGEAFLSTIQKAAEVVASAVRPGPESPSCQRSLQRGDAYQPAVTPSASLGTPASGSPLPVASPGARGIELDSSLGALASPSPGPGLLVTCWGWAGADEEEESSAPMVGAGVRSPTLQVPRHLSEPARDKLAEPAAHKTRLPAASAAVCVGQPCLDPHVQCSLSACSWWELRYYGPTRGGVCPGSRLLRHRSLELGQEPSPALVCSPSAFEQLCSPSGPRGNRGALRRGQAPCHVCSSGAP